VVHDATLISSEPMTDKQTLLAGSSVLDDYWEQYIPYQLDRQYI
jgi:hypothetical protein